jgi:hypothetical protein
MRTRTPMLISLRAGLLALPLTMSALACNSQPIDPTSLSVQAALNAREMVHQTGGGVAFTESSDSGLQKILTGMAHANDGLAGMAHAMMPDMPTSMPPGMSAMSTSPMAQDAAGMPSLLNTEEKFDETADDLKTFLRERIFADANLESKSNDEAVYWLRGEPTCRALPREGDPAGTLPRLDTKCVDDLTKLPVRIVMRADGDGVRLTIELGPDKLELASFIIHSNLLAVEVDFAKAYTASQYAQQTLGESSPMGGTQFEKLVGAMRVSLRKDGEKKVTFATSVLSAIDVAEKSATGVLGTEVKLAATDPLFAVSLDGVAQTASLKLDVGALDVLGTWDPHNTGVANRDLHVAIGGLTGETTFKEGVDELVAKGLGIGATSVKVREMSVFDLGLNPSDMSRFDLKVTVDSANEPHFEITPRFDLRVGTHFSVIAADYALDDQPPAYLLENTYAVKLDNGGATAKLEAVPSNGTFSGGLKIDAGTLTISSNKPTPTSISVPMGMCLTGTSTPPADADPIIGALTAVTCP